MIDLAKNFVLLKVQNAPALVYGILAGIWLLLLAVGFASIISQPKSALWKFLWAFVVLLIPWAGLFIYSIRCAFSADFSFLKPLGINKAARINRE